MLLGRSSLPISLQRGFAVDFKHELVYKQGCKIMVIFVVFAISHYSAL